METSNASDSSTKKSQQDKKVTKQKQSTIKKLDPDTLKLLSSLKEKANKKSFGRKIKDSEIIFAGLKLVTTAEIRALQENSYQEKDLLGICHEDYMKSTSSKLSVDQYLGKLLRGEIAPPTKVNRPE